MFLDRWAKYVAHDPNLNPSLSKENAFYDIPDIKIEESNNDQVMD